MRVCPFKTGTNKMKYLDKFIIGKINFDDKILLFLLVSNYSFIQKPNKIKEIKAKIALNKNRYSP